MGTLRFLLLGLLSLVLGGCGTFADPTSWFGEAEEELISELEDIENKVRPRTLWKRDIGAGADEKLLGLRPRVMGDTLYVADAGGRVQALDAASGRVKWDIDLDLPISGGPGAGNGLVLLGTSEGELIALEGEGGSERWRAQLSSEILSVPAIGGGVVVIHTSDGKLFGIEATNGKERWRYEREVPVLTLRGISSPVISGRAVFTGMAGGKLIAVRLDNGALLWEASITVPGGRSELERLADIDGDPIVFGGGVFAATYQGEVAAVEQGSGRPAWRRKMSVHSGMGFDRQRLYVSDAEGIVWALDARSGSAVWSQDSMKHRKLSDAAVLGDLVVVGDFEGYLHWMDGRDGKLLGRTRVGSEPITGGMQVVDDVLYVQGDGGALAAIRLPDAP